MDLVFRDEETAAAFDVQLKCTESVPADGDHSFALPVNNYNALRSTNRQAPAILVVVGVPDNLQKWMTHSDEELVLRRCAHWVSLRGMGETSNTSTVSVTVPRAQVFDASTVWHFLDRMLEDGG